MEYGITPGQYYDMGMGEKLLLRAIVERKLDKDRMRALAERQRARATPPRHPARPAKRRR